MKKLLLPALIMSLSINIILSVILISSNIKTNTNTDIANMTDADINTNVYKRHDYQWYTQNTLKQIVADDFFNTFKDEITDNIKIYIVAKTYPSGNDYATFDTYYRQLFGGHLKKQDYYLNECYSYEYQSGQITNDSIYAGSFGGTVESEKWSNNCRNNVSNTQRMYGLLSISEQDDGYMARMYYVELALKTNEETDEVWYETVNQNTEKRFSCGYDKTTCDYNEIRKYIEENKNSLTTYKVFFKTIGEAEAITSVERE